MLAKSSFPHYFGFSCHDVIRYLSCQNIQPYLSLPFSVRKSKQRQAGASRLSQFPHMEVRGRMLPSAEERSTNTLRLFQTFKCFFFRFSLHSQSVISLAYQSRKGTNLTRCPLHYASFRRFEKKN